MDFIDYTDELDQWEICDYLASELEQLKQHRDILGDSLDELTGAEDID